jgi:hypothetical protein
MPIQYAGEAFCELACVSFRHPAKHAFSLLISRTNHRVQSMPSFNRYWMSIGLFLALICSTGCGSKDSNVSGEVTLNGQPLKQGIIRFVPVDGKTQTADAQIVEGKFSATVPAGEKRIEISAPKVVGKKKMIDEPGAKEVEEVAELLPERYNVKSELKMNVESGKQQKQFALTMP